MLQDIALPVTLFTDFWKASVIARILLNKAEVHEQWKNVEVNTKSQKHFCYLSLNTTNQNMQCPKRFGPDCCL